MGARVKRRKWGAVAGVPIWQRVNVDGVGAAIIGNGKFITFSVFTQFLFVIFDFVNFIAVFFKSQTKEKIIKETLVLYFVYVYGIYAGKLSIFSILCRKFGVHMV